ncbi:hypothetical protein V1477_009214 [Vespula maculifrons]|uniref:Uncharacterized protein n=1 Tax=Vespula maculifrons TaxID=7453 RepID=A0ABD2CC22_VESMC
MEECSLPRSLRESEYSIKLPRGWISSTTLDHRRIKRSRITVTNENTTDYFIKSKYSECDRNMGLVDTDVIGPRKVRDDVERRNVVSANRKLSYIEYGIHSVPTGARERVEILWRATRRGIGQIGANWALNERNYKLNQEMFKNMTNRSRVGTVFKKYLANISRQFIGSRGHDSLGIKLRERF